MTRFVACLCAVFFLSFQNSVAYGQSATEFTYQGELYSGGNASQGPHDIQLRLFDAADGGNMLGDKVCLAEVPVVDGRFLATLDFGSQFESFGRYIEVSIRQSTGLSCDDDDAFVTLLPRQKITGVPQAGFAEVAGLSLFADSADSLDGQPGSFYTSATNLASGTLSDTRLSGNVPLRSIASTQSFLGSISAPSFIGSGNNLTGLNASNIASGLLNDARLTSNIPRLDSTLTQFSGILQIETDNAQALRFRRTGSSFSTYLTLGSSGSDAAIRAGSNTRLIFGTALRPNAVEMAGSGRLILEESVSIGTFEAATTEELRIRGDGTLVRAVLESGGTDQIAELVFYENMSNTNGVILREDGRGSTNSLLVIDVTSGGETVMATFDRDTNSFSAPIKAFRIDHPLDPMNKELWHSCVESPEMLNIYSGIVTTDENGYATVVLPAYFSSLNISPRYQLTVIDDEQSSSGVEWVLAKVARPIGRDGDDRFTIRTSSPGTSVSWQVTGVRNDPVAQRFRIEVEQEKPAERRGMLLVPEAYEAIDAQTQSESPTKRAGES